MRRAAAAAVLLVCLLFAVPAADTKMVNNFADLQSNITGAPTGEMRTIIITENFPVDGAAAIPAITSGKNITLTTSLNTGYSITRTGANTSTDTGMFTMNSGGN
ncbi:MAG TPA: hypothetical protein O0X38_07325, partial [Methanocorpusculum sp.]|nr:hypothetical protein [Methanocorpusculum sp.]